MSDAKNCPRKERVVEMFERIAGRYDLANDVLSCGLHRFWKGRMVKLAEIRPGMRALDLCCGTGDVAYRLALAGARVIGVDLSERMLEIARGRRKRFVQWLPADSPQFILANAEQLPFPDESFDVVTCAYGIRNLSDWGRTFMEIHRVLVRKGNMVLLEFGQPRCRIVRAIYFAFLRWVVPVIGKIVTGDYLAYAYIFDSVKRFPAQDEMACYLMDHGFVVRACEEIWGGAMWIMKCEVVK